MRLSTLVDDPGFKYEKLADVKIFLDGEMVKACFTADEEDGMVVVAKFNEDGMMFLDGECVATETRKGNVEIVLPKELEFLRHQ